MPTSIPSSLSTSRALTIYTEGFALVKETRTIPAIGADGIVYYVDVAQLIETDSLIIEGLTVRELRYEYDLANQQKLLEKYIGREITVTNNKTGEARVFRLLSATGGYVMEELGMNELVLDPKGEISLPEHSDLFLQPTLVWQVANQTSDEVRVSYLTQGVSWEMAYILSLKGDRFDLTGWVVLTNNSGKTYEDTNIRLIAGTVHRTPQQMMKAVMYEAASVDLSQQQSFADYHLYTLQGRNTLKDRQQKQLQLLAAKNAIAKTIYEVNQYSKHPSIYIEFENTKANGLGFPLPKGDAKMFKENPNDSSVEFIGEDRIENTAVNEKVRLKSGEAFDITSESKTINTYKQGNYEFEVIEYEIRNAKKQAVNVIIHHLVHGKNWTVTESSHGWERKNDEIIIPVHIPASGKERVRFTIRYDRNVQIKPE